MPKLFPTGVIVTITTGTFLCEIGQVYEILNYLTSDNLFTHQLPRAMRECAPTIHQQLPWTASPELAAAVAAFGKAINNAPETKEARQSLCSAFVDSLSAIYGEKHELTPLAAYEHVYRDPISEAAEMMGEDNVIVVKTKGGNQ